MRIPTEHRVIDWEALYVALADFIEAKASAATVEKKVSGMIVHFNPEVARLFDLVLGLSEGSGERRSAYEQCPIGLLSVCIVEAISLASMHTEHIETKLGCIQGLMAEIPIFTLAGSKWPVFKLLDYLWALNKLSFGKIGYANINRFVQRQYADLVLRPEELAPFGLGRSVPWSSWLRADPAGSSFRTPLLEEMVVASRSTYNGFGPLLYGLTTAAWESVQKDGRTGSGGKRRPVVRVSLVFGEAWAALMPLSWARWGSLGFRAAVFVTMDEASLRKCQEFYLICVPTGVTSVLHKYTIATLAMHLGIDVLYCDMDAVPVGPDPLSALFDSALGSGDEAVAAAVPDLAVSTHNYDCLNAGVWFARASDATAAFFLLLLEYLYEHWYEGDQRSFNALATGNVSVSFQAQAQSRMPTAGMHVVVLSPDVFAGTEGFADAQAVQLFHAYKLYGDEKLGLVSALYGAFDIPADVGASRKSIWDWAAEPSTKAQLRAKALERLRPYQRARESTRCW